MSIFFECFHRSTIKTKAISVRYPVTSPTCQLTDHQLADTIGQNADILIDIIWTNRLATFRECIELISVVIKSLKVSASWRVGELTCRRSDPSSDGQKKNHLPMEGPMLGFSACVYHSRFITPFSFYMWKYLKLHFTVWILHTYLCLRKPKKPKDNQGINLFQN